MNRCLFLAGATGVIGRHVAPLFVADGWRVFGTTRSQTKAAALQAIGVEPVVVDVFDAVALGEAMKDARPDVVMHQLTDLPPGLDPAQMEAALVRNARIREEGTRNLIDAALRAGAKKLVAQSIAFAYAEGPLPHHETDPLNVDAQGLWGVSARAVASLETQVLEAPLGGIVLRYGRLYGPGTGFDTPTGAGPVHVDAAAYAAYRTVAAGVPGIYNIAEDDGALCSDKAKQWLGWNAGWRVGQ